MPDLALLTRVRDAMKAKWRAESFIADKGELPFFAALTKELGWQGLHARFRHPGHQRWTTERWNRQALSATAAAEATARASVHADFDAAEARVHAAGGAR
jgi:hypothetical protein